MEHQYQLWIIWKPTKIDTEWSRTVSPILDLSLSLNNVLQNVYQTVPTLKQFVLKFNGNIIQDYDQPMEQFLWNKENAVIRLFATKKDRVNFVIECKDPIKDRSDFWIEVPLEARFSQVIDDLQSFVPDTNLKHYFFKHNGKIIDSYHIPIQQFLSSNDPLNTIHIETYIKNKYIWDGKKFNHIPHPEWDQRQQGYTHLYCALFLLCIIVIIFILKVIV